MEQSSENILLLTDSYKVTHHRMYPPGTTRSFFYFESRGGKFQSTVFFGLQIILKRYLSTIVTMEMVDEAERFFANHLPDTPRNAFNRAGWEHIIKKHNGRLPLLVRAVPEGTVVPVKNVLFTVENTDDEVPWLPGYVEGVMEHVWYTMTVCTNSFEQKRVLSKFMKSTCDTQECLSFKLHDFGFRGSAGVQAAGDGGCAHLVNFHSSDNLHGIITAQKFYSCKAIPAVSVPASEHSVMNSWGEKREVEATQHILTKAYPEGPVSVVCDSYDIFNFIDTVIGVDLKQDIVSRTGVVVIRPDSGDPSEMVLEVLKRLEAIFSTRLNEKGFKVLPDFIRILQGDGISIETLTGVCSAMESNNWSLDNITFGSGGALLQKVNRDTQKCAYKCSSSVINGEEVDVFKNPRTDPSKKSKAGRLTLVKNKLDGSVRTARREVIDTSVEVDMFVDVYRDGVLLREYTFDDIRELAGEEFSSQKK